ncbi:MAG: ATP-dependent DNA helicase RecG [bacterium]
MNLQTTVEKLNQVGKTTAKRLQRLGINTARDLLYHFPFRYEDYRQVVKIKDLQNDQTASLKVKIELINNKRSARKRRILTQALVSDDTDSLRVVWFGQPFITKVLKPGDTVFLSGKVKQDMLGCQMVGPVYEKEQGGQTTHTARLVPMYALTSNLTQKQIRFLVSQAIGLAEQVRDWLPDKILSQANLISLPKALKGIHFPDNEKELKQSTDRLKFDELFLIQLKAEMSRSEKQSSRACRLPFREKQIKQFVKSLPFILTKPQKVSSWEILQDLDKTTPMNRLLSGDVGSGKTVVAAMAMYNTTLNGLQAVLMAPTEILAVQHYHEINKLLGKKLCIGLMTQAQLEINDKQLIKKTKARQRGEFLDLLGDNKIQIVVGTHALLSKGVDFGKLGLVIVDEQHRFGVEQRKNMKQKGIGVHFLSMTATPIPRSLALMLYGDLDVSIINELPPGRKPVLTRLVEPLNRSKAYDFIRTQVKNGRQVFVVCPLIEDLEASEKKSVLSEYEKLSKQVFPKLRVGYLHGKMKSKEKEETMHKFKQGILDILVSTSVIEVGVDIPNASVMMIEGAERFGLAQLHQFRGRVGRSVHQSYCFLFVENYSPKAGHRLKYFEKTRDGFNLAEKDLEIRGPGEVYGTTQSGMMNLSLARLTDHELIKKARDMARIVMSDLKQYPQIADKFKQWEDQVHLE